MTFPDFDSNEFLELLRRHQKWGTPLPEDFPADDAPQDKPAPAPESDDE
jgi:hypothetical protein